MHTGPWLSYEKVFSIWLTWHRSLLDSAWPAWIWGFHRLLWISLSFFFNLYFWLHWVFIAVHGFFSSCGKQGLLSSCHVWISHRGDEHAASVVHSLSCPVACGIFADQGLSQCPLHCMKASWPLNPEGSQELFVPSRVGVPNLQNLIMTWDGADVIIELKCTLNVTLLNHSETIPSQSVEKLSSWNWFLVPKTLKTTVVEIPGVQASNVSKIFMCFLLVPPLSHSWRESFLLTLLMFCKWGSAFEKAISSYWTVTSPRVSRREKRFDSQGSSIFERAPGHHQWYLASPSLPLFLSFLSHGTHSFHPSFKLCFINSNWSGIFFLNALSLWKSFFTKNVVSDCSLANGFNKALCAG